MNLLIEQRSTAITSKLQSSFSHETHVNNPFSSSSLVLKLKRQKIKQQQQLDRNSNSSPMANEDNKTTTNPRLKRPILNSSIRRPSSPAFNGKQQQLTKRSVVLDNNNNNLTPHIEEISSTKRFKQDDLNQSSTTKVDASVGTVSIGLATEPDQLGPCEPGTSVILEGIVWNETDNGVLVVNVTWRGKTYVGTLLDSTKQDWACPRLTCESPTSDYDPRSSSSSSKTSRAKRGNANGNNRYSFHQISSNILSSGSDDRKLRNNIKTRQSKRTNFNAIDETGLNNTNSSPLASPFPSTGTFFSSSNHETQLIPCPESQCHKQFVSTTALNYHLSNAHKKTEPMTTVTIPQANTRDEEDVAHILANVADYVRRSSPRSSPDHQRQPTLTWPCPQISSNLVLSSSLNNNEQISILLPTNSTRCMQANTEQDDIKSTVTPADHFLLHIEDDPSVSSWTNSKNDRSNDNKKPLKIPTPPPPPSTFLPINLTSTLQPPPTASSPAYSDISDEDPTTTTTTTSENEQISPSTINLLNESSLLPNPSWTPQMRLQQYGSYMQHVNKELTSNCLNSKSNPNGTSDSTVKNILDARRSSTTKPSSPTNNPLLNDYQKTLYHYHTNGITNESKLAPSIITSLTSPNENLLNPSTTTSSSSIQSSW